MLRIIAFFALTVTAFADEGDAIVRCSTSQSMYSGTVITGSLVLTAKHCVEGVESLPVQVRFRDGRTVTGKCIAMARSSEGPALLRIPEGDYPTLKIAASMPAAKSVPVRACGYPHGTYTLMETSGSLYPGNGKLTDGRSSGTFVNEMDRPLKQGYSGGPVLNSRNEIIGVVSSTDDRTSLHVTHSDISKFVAKYGVRADVGNSVSEVAQCCPPPAPYQQWGGGVGIGGPRGGVGVGIGGYAAPAPRPAPAPTPIRPLPDYRLEIDKIREEVAEIRAIRGSPGEQGPRGDQGPKGEPGAPGRDVDDQIVASMRAEISSLRARMQAELANLKGELSKPDSGADSLVINALKVEIAGLKAELAKLQDAKIPVQILTPDGEVFDEATYKLGNPIKLKLAPK